MDPVTVVLEYQALERITNNADKYPVFDGPTHKIPKSILDPTMTYLIFHLRLTSCVGSFTYELTLRNNTQMTATLLMPRDYTPSICILAGFRHLQDVERIFNQGVQMPAEHVFPRVFRWQELFYGHPAAYYIPSSPRNA